MARCGASGPAGRRDWAEAIWAEAPEVPPGLRRLAWRAGGARLIAREALMRRGIGSAMLFAVAAAVAAGAAWPGSSASSATPANRVGMITMVLLLAGLPLLTRWFLGPPDNRAARSAAGRLLRRVPGPDTGRDHGRAVRERAATRGC